MTHPRAGGFHRSGRTDAPPIPLRRSETLTDTANVDRGTGAATRRRKPDSSSIRRVGFEYRGISEREPSSLWFPANAGRLLGLVETASYMQRVRPYESPSLKRVVGHLSLNLLNAIVAPAALFYVCLVTLNISWALGAALAWCYLGMAWRALTKRRMSGLLLLTGLALTARTAVAYATGGTFFYFLQPILSDTVLATVFFLSLATARPIVARLAGDFYPMNADIAARPRIRTLLWRLTLLWATVILAKAAITFWLLQSHSLVTFVVLKSVVLITMTATAVTVTVWTAARVARSEGLLHTA